MSYPPTYPGDGYYHYVQMPDDSTRTVRTPASSGGQESSTNALPTGNHGIYHYQWTNAYSYYPSQGQTGFNASNPHGSYNRMEYDPSPYSGQYINPSSYSGHISTRPLQDRPLQRRAGMTRATLRLLKALPFKAPLHNHILTNQQVKSHQSQSEIYSASRLHWTANTFSRLMAIHKRPSTILI